MDRNYVDTLSELDPEKVLALRLSEDEDPGLLQDLFEIFCSESRIQLRCMTEGLRTKDYNKVSRSAHTFCSTCHNLAATQLGHAVKGVEIQSSVQADPQRIEEMLHDIEVATDRVQLKWGKMLAEYLAASGIQGRAS
jgi:HPt (histidine-containing phosphotransfer) domain-containing protein